MLVVKIFQPLGEADGGESFLVEGTMVAAAQVTIAPVNERGLEAIEIFAAHLSDSSRQQPRWRIIFPAQGA